MNDLSALILSSSAWRLRPTLARPLPVLAAGQLHEVHGAVADRAALIGFALGFAGAAGQAANGADDALNGTPNGLGAIVGIIAAQRGSPARWYGAGLAGLGIDPARLVLVDAPDPVAALRAALDAARCPGVATVLLDSQGPLPRYDLTTSRRFVLAAEVSRARVIVVRAGAPPAASAAQTRWQVSPARSVALATPFAMGPALPGPPAVEVECLRWRGGPAGQRWRLEWDMEHGGFLAASDAQSGAVVPLSRPRAGEGGLAIGPAPRHAA